MGQAGPPDASERGAPLPGAPSFPLNNTFMAVAYDQGDNQQHGVHPRFKSEPARRLALQLIHNAFGTSTPYSGPLPVSAHLATKATVLSGHEGAACVRVVVSHSTMLRLNDTHTCNEQFERKCCAAGATGFGARICTAAAAADCAKDADGKTVFNANVTIDSPTSILVTAIAAGNSMSSAAASFVEFGVTDFPQCSVVNELGIALGPFILPVK